MTTTSLDIVKRALRKIGKLAGGDEPDADQAHDALTTLQSLFLELVEIGTFGRLNDVLATSDYTANEWERVRASAGVTVTLPTTITGLPSYASTYGGDYGWNWGPYDYGWRYSSLPRAPFNMAPVSVIDSTGAETVSLYVASKGGWVSITGMTTASAFPLSGSFDDGFACLLAERIVDEYGGQLSDATKRGAMTCRYMLSTKGSNARRPSSAAYY